MTPNPYQEAYEAAFAELSEIARTIQQLSLRKNHVAHLVSVLQPMVGTAEMNVDAAVSAKAAEVPHHSELADVHAEAADSPEDSADPSSYSYLEVPAPLPDLEPEETAADPFQRRVKTSFRFRGLATQRSF